MTQQCQKCHEAPASKDHQTLRGIIRVCGPCHRELNED